MTSEEREKLQQYGAFRHQGWDMLGPYVSDCVRGRQVVCRDTECTEQRCCKRVPKELRDNGREIMLKTRVIPTEKIDQADAPYRIVSMCTVRDRLFVATECRVYELIDGVLRPLVFVTQEEAFTAAEGGGPAK